MTNNTTKEPPWLDLQSFMAALRRAARKEAVRTHADLIQVRDGKIVRISPTNDTETTDAEMDTPVPSPY